MKKRNLAAGQLYDDLVECFDYLDRWKTQDKLKKVVNCYMDVHPFIQKAFDSVNEALYALEDEKYDCEE